MELFIYTIYDHPQDYPENFVVRRNSIQGGFPKIDESYIKLEKTLDAARLHIPYGLAKLDRDPSDYPCIVESYI